MTEPNPAATRSPRPPLSVTISTVQGWPEIAANLRTVIDSVSDIGGEVVVTDGSGNQVPQSDEVGPGVVWLSYPGESVFQLRDRGYKAAGGEIVAITEDHVRVPPDWARKILDAHAAHPEATAIGGSVENAATGNAMDWGSFLVVQAAVAAPIQSGPAKRLSGAVNVAYKRHAIEAMETYGGLGAMDGLHQRHLAATGATLLSDDTIRVLHDQSLGFRGTTAIHYNAGRTMSGFKRQHMDAVQWLRVIGAPIIPLARFARAVALLTPRGYGPQIARSGPAMLWLLYSQGVGQFVGYLAGPGDSPGKVQ
jgi:hypothetical protein